MSSFTVFGTWSNAASSSGSHSIDLEAQTITGTRVSIPAPPRPAAAHSPRIQAEEETTDPIDDFFGVTRPRRSGTHESRHDIVAIATPQEEAALDMPPPPYADAYDLPSYTSVAEPPTLAMYLFKFGFLFPLFWFAGIIVLLSPLQAPENWEPTKTEAERQEIIELLRRTERKWAKRCLIAFIVFALIALAVSITTVMVMRS
ncbi:hypothetical protein ABKN59_011933 [Abortiporus biennis]